MTTVIVSPEQEQQAVIDQLRSFAEGVQLLNQASSAGIKQLARLCFYRELALAGKISG